MTWLFLMALYGFACFMLGLSIGRLRPRTLWRLKYERMLKERDEYRDLYKNKPLVERKKLYGLFGFQTKGKPVKAGH